MSDMFEEYSKLLDNTEKHLSFETLAIYSNMKDQLSSREMKFIELHIEKCNSCKTKLEQIIEEDLEIDPGKSMKLQIFRIPKFVRYAAAASILIAIGITYYLSSLPKQENIILSESNINKETINALPADTIKIVEKEEGELDRKIEQELNIQNQELYAVNVVLENFIERNLRSDRKLMVLLPEINEVVQVPIKFQWKRYNFSGDVELEIVDNKNKKIIKKRTNLSSIQLAKTLSKGLYYWKIKADGKIEDIGKFKVM